MQLECFPSTPRAAIGGKARAPQWHWRLRAANGHIIADGAEGYSRKGNVLRAAERIAALLRPLPNGQPVPIVVSGDKPQKAKQ